MSKEIPFEPYPFLHNPFRQTILSVALTFFSHTPTVCKLVSLADGDKIALEIATPAEWKPTDLTVILVHGLCGSHKSPNPARLAGCLHSMGIRSVRYNMRGCGSGKGLAKQIYHSGRTEDLFESIKAVKLEYPASPIVLIGFSLGGNVVLKLAAELGSLAETFLSKVIAASPPVDLDASIRMFGDPKNAFFERYFYKQLRQDVIYRHNKFKDLPRVDLPKNLKLYEFDQIYTAPMAGFKSAEDYYNKCSSIYVINDIAIPCKILLAEDDPIISASSLDGVHLPSNIDLFKTKKGGHLGYLGRPKNGKGFHWLDSLLVEWITDDTDYNLA